MAFLSVFPSSPFAAFPLIIPLPPILPPDAVDPFPAPFSSDRPALATQPILLAFHGIIIQLDQPVGLPVLVLALVAPFLDPLALLLVVDEILAPVLQHRAALGAAAELADALFARELLPRRRLFGFW